jgi:hypothetical protein
MNKSIYLLIILLPLLMFFCKKDGTESTDKKSQSRKALITGSSVRLRGEPGLTGREIVQILRGTEVEVLAETDKETLIDGIKAKWYRVKHSGKEGWAFGGYLSLSYRKSPDGSVMLWSTGTTNEPPSTLYFFNGSNNHYGEIKLPEFAGGYIISKSNKYIALDSGTDVVRDFSIYSLVTGERLYGASSSGNSEWDGDRISVKKVNETLDGCTLWEEMIFDDGSVKKGSKTGKGDFHVMGKGPDPRCR